MLSKSTLSLPAKLTKYELVLFLLLPWTFSDVLVLTDISWAFLASFQLPWVHVRAHAFFTSWCLPQETSVTIVLHMWLHHFSTLNKWEKVPAGVNNSNMLFLNWKNPKNYWNSSVFVMCTPTQNYTWLTKIWVPAYTHTPHPKQHFPLHTKTPWKIRIPWHQRGTTMLKTHQSTQNVLLFKNKAIVRKW